DDGGAVRLTWFNQPFRRDSLRVGLRLVASGRLRSTVLNWEMVQPTITPLAEGAEGDPSRPLPRYPLTEGLKQPAVRAMMREVAEPLIQHIDEVLPESLRERLHVVDVHRALHDIHFP